MRACSAGKVVHGGGGGGEHIDTSIVLVIGRTSK